MRLARPHSVQYYYDLLEEIRSAPAVGSLAAFKMETLARRAEGD
jgi:hypothetical protein